MSEYFKFLTRSQIVFLLGIRATNPKEFMEGLRKAPASSIYYHTHRLILQHRLKTPSPPNDFAYWVISFLDLEDLGELLASVDIMSLGDFEQVRGEYIRVITHYLAKHKRAYTCAECHEFYFMTSRIFILPTSHESSDLKEFLSSIARIPPASLFYHMYESKIRFGRAENDFSSWLRKIGEQRLADDISYIDPYSLSLEGLRRKIIDLGGKCAG